MRWVGSIVGICEISSVPDELQFNLLENALDSVDYGIDLLVYEKELTDQVRYKRAILAISHAIELLLKERLRLIHPSLVWEKVEHFPSLEARTVTPETALLRLKNIGALAFSKEDEALLRALRKTRNAIEHYAWVLSGQEAALISGASLAFAAYFMEQHLACSHLAYAEREGGVLSDLLSKNKVFADAYKERTSYDYVSNYGHSEACDFCSALLKSEDDGVCSRCGHWNNKIVGEHGIPF